MRRIAAMLALTGAVVFCAVKTDPGPVTCTMLSPVDGSTVSGTIQITVNASSLAGPIQRVEFYRDGELIGIVSNTPAAPSGPYNLYLAEKKLPPIARGQLLGVVVP